MLIKVGGETYPTITHKTTAIGPLLEFQLQIQKLYGLEGKMSFLNRIAREQQEFGESHSKWVADGCVGDEPEPPDYQMLCIGMVAFLSVRAVKRVSLQEVMDAPMEFIREPGDEEDQGGEQEDPTVPGNDTPATPDNDENHTEPVT